MNIKEVFEKCNDGDFVKDNNGDQWKVENEGLVANYWYKTNKGDLTANCCYITDLYSLRQIMDLEFKKLSIIDWSKVAVDTKILVSFDNEKWYKRYFAKFEDGKIYTFANGTTSFSNNYRELVQWEYAKLYKEEK